MEQFILLQMCAGAAFLWLCCLLRECGDWSK